MQTNCNRVDVYVETDDGCCHTTRTSTSGGAMMHGLHLVKHLSTPQTTVALSSAEAELVALSNLAMEVLGMRPMALEWEVVAKDDVCRLIPMLPQR